MIYALAHPVALAGLLVGFLVGATLRGYAQASAARRIGHVGVGRDRLTLDPRRQLDPFGTVAAVIAGVGWAAPVRVVAGRRVTGRAVAVALTGPVTNLLLAIIGIAAYVAVGGDLGTVGFWPVAETLHGEVGGVSEAARFAQAFAVENVAMAVLSLVPIPPLEAGQLAFARPPRSPGWARFAHGLTEENWGIGLLLLLLLIPLSARGPALLAFVDIVGGALLGVLG